MQTITVSRTAEGRSRSPQLAYTGQSHGYRRHGVLLVLEDFGDLERPDAYERGAISAPDGQSFIFTVQAID